ncbi:MAG: outer membrane protein transport protein, partial [Moraxella osloensis]|nr:outer membrane protein transport protein [Moraxella osloensis]MBD3768450.1 outer membrane protein transport protein [Gammaproteobacteria bacterium]
KHETFGIDQDSDGTSYLMPGFGYATKKNGLTWGVGILGQGGMGTEYGKATSSSDLFYGGMSMMGSQTLLSGEENRSELSVGRVIVPVNMEVNDKLTVGGSIDYIWAGMDIMMDMSGGQFKTLADGGNVSGTMYQGLGSMMTAGYVQDVNWARFDFSDDSDYTGQAKGTGLGGKLGLTYKINDKLSVGASYHTKTNISDMKGDATLSMQVSGDDGVFAGGAPTTTYSNYTLPVTGSIKVKDFQWPATFALGMAYRPTDKWLVTADFKRINWSETMKDFRIVFTADNSASNGSFAGKSIDVTLPQNWEDQNVFMLGTAYQYNKNLTVRAGINVANNPVPNAEVNPLFPATVERHYTLGMGYNFNENSTVDFSLTHAPATEVKGSGDLNQG